MVQDHRRGTKTLLSVTITDLYHGYGPDIASRSGDRVSVSWKEKVVTVQQPRREIGQLKGDFLGEQTGREIWRLRQAIDIRSKTSGNYAKKIGKKVFWSPRLDSPEIWIGVEIKQVDSPKSAHLSSLGHGKLKVILVSRTPCLDPGWYLYFSIPWARSAQKILSIAYLVWYTSSNT